LKFEDVIELFGSESVDRLKTLTSKRRQLVADLDSTDEEIKALLAGNLTAEPIKKATKAAKEDRRVRHCGCCGSAEHGAFRKKTPDGRPTCVAYPQGKPLDVAA
jgi:hypothetical protein